MAVNVALYDVPTVPFGSEVLVICSDVDAVTVSESAALADTAAGSGGLPDPDSAKETGGAGRITGASGRAHS